MTLKRTELRRSTQIKRKKLPRRRVALNPVSDKRRAERQEREDVRRRVLDRDGGCVARKVPTGVACGGALEVHEPLTRARGGDYLDPDQCVSICFVHHQWTHSHPREALAYGLLKNSWES